jgi:hypothetical protein
VLATVENTVPFRLIRPGVGHRIGQGGRVLFFDQLDQHMGHRRNSAKEFDQNNMNSSGLECFRVKKNEKK